MHSESQMDEWCTVLRTWASFGAALQRLSRRRALNWDAAQSMIDAVRPVLELKAEHLRKLLTESREKLAPLEEPFDVDLGLHRWLHAEREEAYSDWLEWVVAQAKTPQRVLKLFGLDSPPDGWLEGQAPHDAWAAWPPCEKKREECIYQGRLDLVIRFANQAIIVIEVKTTDADAPLMLAPASYVMSPNRLTTPSVTTKRKALGAEGGGT